jgi:hypothetical protein
LATEEVDLEERGRLDTSQAPGHGAVDLGVYHLLLALLRRVVINEDLDRRRETEIRLKAFWGTISQALFQQVHERPFAALRMMRMIAGQRQERQRRQRLDTLCV